MLPFSMWRANASKDLLSTVNKAVAVLKKVPVDVASFVVIRDAGVGIVKTSHVLDPALGKIFRERFPVEHGLCSGGTDIRVIDSGGAEPSASLLVGSWS